MTSADKLAIVGSEVPLILDSIDFKIPTILALPLSGFTGVL